MSVMLDVYRTLQEDIDEHEKDIEWLRSEMDKVWDQLTQEDRAALDAS